MNDYTAILAYAVFAFGIFTLAMVWRLSRKSVMKRFHLLNYHSKGDDPKAPHIV